MKKIVSLLIAVILTISVIIPVEVAAADTLFLSFDSTTGCSVFFSSTVAIEPNNKREGAGSLKWGFTDPAANSTTNQIGGMLVCEFASAQNLSSYDGYKFDIYFPAAISSGSGLQVNFASGEVSHDGYNYIFPLDGRAAGWHTLSISKADVATVPSASPDWASIRRIRITWFNYSNATNISYFLLDNLCMTKADVPAPDPTPDPSANTCTPYAIHDGELMLHNCDTYTGISSFFNTTLANDTSVKKEGAGSLRMGFTAPTANSSTSQIGGMVRFDFSSAQNLSAYNSFSFDLYMPMQGSKSSGLQVNFASGTNEDGYNFLITLNERPAGWNTFSIDKKAAEVISSVSPSWESITRVRIIWFNYSNATNTEFFLLDNLRMSKLNSTLSHIPYKLSDNSYMINNADTVNGWSSHMNTTISRGANLSEGNGSVALVANVPNGQSANIGAMAFLTLPNAINLSSYEKISFKIHLEQAFVGAHQIQMNFISVDGKDDGFNYTISLSNKDAGWYTLTFTIKSLTAQVSGSSWNGIKRIRLTWFNIAQQNINQVITVDDIRALPSGYNPNPSTSSPAYKPDFTYGDINEDGNINTLDALFALQSAVSKRVLSTRQEFIADVAGETNVSSVDALAILQYSVEQLTKFTPPARKDYPTPKNEPIVKSSSLALNNGAYERDATADNSFRITSEGLQPNTMYVVSTSVVDKGYDYARFIYSLQGLINREFGMDAYHSSILYVIKFNIQDNQWYNYMTGNNADSPYKGFHRVNIGDWDTFYKVFEKQIKQCGYIAWDGNVPATANVAATICGLDGYIPVRSGCDLETYLTSKGVSKKQSLVGMFTGKGTITGTSIASTGSPKNDAYRWAIEKYFSRCTAKYLGYTPDGAQTVPGTSYYNSSQAFRHSLENHDYLIARRAFFFDLSPYAGEVACDAGGGKAGLDNETMLLLFKKRYDRDKNGIGQLMGFIPWYIKYSADAIGGAQGAMAATYLEWLMCEYLGCYNLTKEADAAGTVSMTNGSAFYKYTVKQKFSWNKTIKTTTFDPDTYYFTVQCGDFDSSAWLNNMISNWWTRDTARGKIDYMWTINPNLSYRVPVIFDYMNKNQTDCDYLVSDEGAGYLIPHGLFQNKKMDYTNQSRPSDHGDASQIWADYNNYFYRTLDMNITGFLINGSNNLDRDIFSCYAKFTSASFHLDITNKFVSVDGVPFVYSCTNFSDDEATKYSIQTSNAGIGMGDYKFCCFRRQNSSPTELKKYVEGYTTYATGKGITVKYVDPYSFFNLVKKSGRLTVK